MQVPRSAGGLGTLVVLASAVLMLAGSAGAVPRGEPCAPSSTSSATGTVTAHPITVGARAENDGRPTTVDFGKLPPSPPTGVRKNPPPARTQPSHRRAKTLKAATTGCVPHSAPTVGSGPARH
jgi:hypothetical protein